jgi:hypothetical protein
LVGLKKDEVAGFLRTNNDLTSYVSKMIDESLVKEELDFLYDLLTTLFQSI